MLFSGNRQACGVELKKIINGGGVVEFNANNFVVVAEEEGFEPPRPFRV
jgi:hypothetical protein